MTENEYIEELFIRLSKSKFRSSFHLSKQDKQFIINKGLPTIKKHAYDFVNSRLKPAVIINDGKQTPYKGHPVFISMHATGCCCRKCLNKWHKIPLNVELKPATIDFIVDVIIAYIKKELNNND